ncbi:group II intron maturase-specific domain-containing protein [Bradyrhizobium huanghuaihaiense]
MATRRRTEAASHRQGWLNYYGRFYWTECVNVLRQVNDALARWTRRNIGWDGSHTE